MNSFSGRLPATSSPASSATASCWAWPCTGLPHHAVKWVRELSPWEKSLFILIFPIYLSISSFLGGFFFFPGDRVHHPAHYTNRTIRQEGHRRNKLLARARNCTGQLKHPLAHRVPDHSFNPFGDPLPAMVIFISMSATTDSLLNGP